MTKGAMGECPDWYETIQAARYLNVAPWDLAERPICWREWALASARAEAAAEVRHNRPRPGVS